MYWTVAGGCVGRLIEELRLRTGWMVDGWQADPRVREIMRFPGRMHLGGGTFPSFADGGPRPTLPSACSPVGGRVGAPARPARLLATRSETDVAAIGVGDRCRSSCALVVARDSGGGADPGAGGCLAADLQVVVAHGGGTALAARHTTTNHNHWTSASSWFIATALLAVPAVATTPPRPSVPGALWWTRGAGHVVPQIDGHEQVLSRACCACGLLPTLRRPLNSVSTRRCLSVAAGLHPAASPVPERGGGT
jgi:hypothetical protein